jgi:hypothetical protein
MVQDDDSFLRRWSRRKRASAIAAPSASQAAPPLPELPPVEGLTFDSDFEAFMHAKVDERVRRSALKKLFGDPRFNVMDGLDIYIDDYSKEDPIPAAMLAGLEHARVALFAPRAEEEKKAPDEGTPPERSASNAPVPSTDTDRRPSQ